MEEQVAIPSVVTIATNDEMVPAASNTIHSYQRITVQTMQDVAMRAITNLRSRVLWR